MTDTKRLLELERKAKSKRRRAEDKTEEARLRVEAQRTWDDLRMEFGAVLEEGAEGKDADLYRALKRRNFNPEMAAPEAWFETPFASRAHTVATFLDLDHHERE